MKKTSYNMKELADLLDVGESTLTNQIVPVIRAVLAEVLDETVKTLVNQEERIRFLEEDNAALNRRLSEVEAKLYPELAGGPLHQLELVEPAMVDLESVLGIEMEGAPPPAEAEAPPSETGEEEPPEAPS
jgi:hypothetical protein